MIAAFHAPQRSRRGRTVVVVGLKDVAERVERELVVVAEVVRVHGETGSVGQDAQRESTGPHAAVVRDEPGSVVDERGTAVVVDRARAQPASERVLHHVRPRVARVEPPRAVGAADERVQAVVVVEAAKSREERLASVCYVVAVVIVQDPRGGGARDDDPRSQDRDAERRDELGKLREDLGALAHAVLVEIREDHDAIAFLEGEAGIASAPLAVVDRLGDPNAAARIDVEGRRVVEGGRARPERHARVARRIEALAEVGDGESEEKRREHGAAPSCRSARSFTRAGSPWRRVPRGLRPPRTPRSHPCGARCPLRPSRSTRSCTDLRRAP